MGEETFEYKRLIYNEAALKQAAASYRQAKKADIHFSSVILYLKLDTLIKCEINPVSGEIKIFQNAISGDTDYVVQKIAQLFEIKKPSISHPFLEQDFLGHFPSDFGLSEQPDSYPIYVQNKTQFLQALRHLKKENTKKKTVIFGSFGVLQFDNTEREPLCAYYYDEGGEPFLPFLYEFISDYPDASFFAIPVNDANFDEYLQDAHTELSEGKTPLYVQPGFIYKPEEVPSEQVSQRMTVKKHQDKMHNPSIIPSVVAGVLIGAAVTVAVIFTAPVSLPAIALVGIGLGVMFLVSMMGLAIYKGYRKHQEKKAENENKKQRDSRESLPSDTQSFEEKSSPEFKRTVKKPVRGRSQSSPAFFARHKEKPMEKEKEEADAPVKKESISAGRLRSTSK